MRNAMNLWLKLCGNIFSDTFPENNNGLKTKTKSNLNQSTQGKREMKSPTK